MSIRDEILRLKAEKNAIIMAHNYQRPEVQDIADFLGDSFALARKARETDADVIIFCGVDFMAEAAAILNPDKTVVHANGESRCPMAGMVDLDKLRKMKEEHPDAKVVAYVNTTAETKAESDVCCTSANAVRIVEKIDADEIIFIPDRHLGEYVQSQVPHKRIILWPGYCYAHEEITPELITNLKKAHPEAEVMIHPECPMETIALADHVFSTGGMVRHAGESEAREFIVGTEEGMAYRLKKLYPEKTFYPVEQSICHNMKKIHLEDVLRALETLEPVVAVPENIAERAKIPLELMLELGRSD